MVLRSYGGTSLDYWRVLSTGGVGRSGIQIVLHCLSAYPLLLYSRLSSVIHITELTDTDDENLDKLAGEDVEELDEEDQDSYELD